MNLGPRIGILGGTFDPIHVGHLDAALAAREALTLDGVIIVPAQVPPHRAIPTTSPYHRFAMAALAVNGVDGLSVSDIELSAPGPGPSYTADTLTRLRDARGLDASQIFFITGADAFAEIETWSRYPEVLDLANFIVVSRPGASVADLRRRLPQLKSRMRLPLGTRGAAAAQTSQTSVFLVDAPTTAVSSTDLRERMAMGRSAAGLLPPGVEQHIHQHGLYEQDSRSSTRADHLHGQNRA
jgi:nicotinate-nucleotide adenylyltransferase